VSLHDRKTYVNKTPNCIIVTAFRASDVGSALVTLACSQFYYPVLLQDSTETSCVCNQVHRKSCCDNYLAIHRGLANGRRCNLCNESCYFLVDFISPGSRTIGRRTHMTLLKLTTGHNWILWTSTCC